MAYPVDNLPPTHPGVFLRDEPEALDLRARKFAEHIHVPHNAVAGSMNGDRSVSAQMAIRLGQAFGTTPQYWLNLQTIYDLKRARAEMPAKALRIKACAPG
nr:HigA family addiction module antitoxin [uncultured Rhodopila sp.]